jgi:hypothetical protein
MCASYPSLSEDAKEIDLTPSKMEQPTKIFRSSKRRNNTGFHSDGDDDEGPVQSSSDSENEIAPNGSSKNKGWNPMGWVRSKDKKSNSRSRKEKGHGAAKNDTSLNGGQGEAEAEFSMEKTTSTATLASFGSASSNPMHLYLLFY